MHGVVFIAVMVQFSMSSYTVSEAAAMIDVAVQITSATEMVKVNVRTMDATSLGRKLYC